MRHDHAAHAGECGMREQRGCLGIRVRESGDSEGDGVGGTAGGGHDLGQLRQQWPIGEHTGEQRIRRRAVGTDQAGLDAGLPGVDREQRALFL